MIRKCGILERTAIKRYREALRNYRDPELHPDHPRCRQFREEASVHPDKDVPIRFLGVWDTVGSLGIPLRGLRWVTRGKYQFHDVELSGSVQSAYQALAIDEHRAPFEPSLWAYVPKQGQTVEQTWFCGAHSDVGGGYAETQLSDIPLQWMMDRAREAGLHIDAAVMAQLPLHPDSQGDLHDSKKKLYRLTPGIDRVFGKSPVDPADPEGAQQNDGTQSVHDSVRQRWNASPRYRPKSLLRYFEEHGKPNGWN